MKNLAYSPLNRRSFTKFCRTVAAGLMGAVLLLPLSACQTLGESARPSPDEPASTVQLPQYDGPQARLLVAQVQDKTGAGWWTPQLGNGMADQLAAELYNTERYVIANRETQSDRTQVRGAKASGAELLVVASVTNIDVEPLIGEIERRSFTVNLQLVDVATLKVLANSNLAGATETHDDDVQIGAGGVLVASLAQWENTATELALRDLVAKAVHFIVLNTPPDYYRYGKGIPVTHDHSGPKPITAAASSAVGLN